MVNNSVYLTSVMENECPGPGAAYGHTVSTCPERHMSPVKALVLSQFRELFVIYGIGVILSIVTFLSEFIPLRSVRMRYFQPASCYTPKSVMRGNMGRSHS